MDNDNDILKQSAMRAEQREAVKGYYDLHAKGDSVGAGILLGMVMWKLGEPRVTTNPTTYHDKGESL